MTDGPTLLYPVVSTQWLADYLGADKLVVLDATVFAVAQASGRASYRSGHDEYLTSGRVPGARFADVIEVLSDPQGVYPFTRPSAQRFGAAAEALGIDNTTTVVIYDSVAGQWAARVWWLFRAFGYDRVAVLDGGLTKWRLEERPMDVGSIEPLAAEASPAAIAFTPTERPELWVDKAYVESVVRGEVDATLVCASPEKEFTGEIVSRTRAGHIPGSVSVPVASLVDGETRELSADSDLQHTLQPAITAGVSRPIVIYCGGGIAAAAVALTLTLLGHRDIVLYDGSLNEWAADPSAELVVGP